MRWCGWQQQRHHKDHHSCLPPGLATLCALCAVVCTFMSLFAAMRPVPARPVVEKAPLCWGKPLVQRKTLAHPRLVVVTPSSRQFLRWTMLGAGPELSVALRVFCKPCCELHLFLDAPPDQMALACQSKRCRPSSATSATLTSVSLSATVPCHGCVAPLAHAERSPKVPAESGTHVP